MSGIFTYPEWDEIVKRKGAHLPHWSHARSIYHVVSRLVDSLPQHILKLWLEERKSIIRLAEQCGRPLSEDEISRLQWLYSEKVENYLDSGYGDCWLKKADIARIIQNSLLHFHQDRYYLHCWCIMPNHMHLLIEPQSEFGLSSLKHSLLSFTAKQANKLLTRHGPFWQHEPYDHIVRNLKEFHFLHKYIMSNPEKAGMKRWKWRGSHSQFSEELQIFLPGGTS